MADTRTERQNAPGPASLEEEVASAQERIYLVECGAHIVGDKERRTMRRMIAVCESDSPVMQKGNEGVGVVGAARQRIGRSSTE
jgi:hypothetical protein